MYSWLNQGKSKIPLYKSRSLRFAFRPGRFKLESEHFYVAPIQQHISKHSIKHPFKLILALRLDLI